MKVNKCVELGIFSELHETPGEFKVRLETVVSEKRDSAKEKLQQQYTPKFQTIRDQIDRARKRVEREESQYKSRRMDSILTVGTSIMGALLGRKRVTQANLGRTSSSMKSLGRSASEKADLSRAEDSLEDLKNKYLSLEQEFNSAQSDLVGKLNVERLTYSEVEIPPRKGDMIVEKLEVVWLPISVDVAGVAVRAY
jgi:hypothetical protein